MKNFTLDQKILSALSDLIMEQDEKPDAGSSEKPDDKKEKKKEEKPEKEGTSKIVTKGAYGSGGFREIFRATASRATADPKSLMKDLGIKSVRGNSDIGRAEDVVSQAVKSNEIMGLAFGSPRSVKVAGKDAIQFPRKASGLPARDATKYIYLTLLGAENAGLLRFEKGIKFLKKNDVTEATIVEL